MANSDINPVRYDGRVIDDGELLSRVPTQAQTEARRDRVRARLNEHSLNETRIDALLLTSATSVRYLTGFTGSDGALLLTKNGVDTVATDGRFTTQIAYQAPELPVIIERSSASALIRQLTSSYHGDHPLRVGIEADSLTLQQYRRLLADVGDDIILVETESIVADERIVKDEGELDLLQQAFLIADTALSEMLSSDMLEAGVTESEVATELDYRMSLLGSEGVSFDTIVAFGANSAIPHHEPDDTVLEPGDFLTIDYGAIFGGYHSDITRTFILGPAANWQRKIYGIVLRAQQAAYTEAVPGALCSSVDAAARGVIVSEGYGQFFTHSTGHGVGLEVHEAPSIRASAAGTLKRRSPITLEPGIYLPGQGGVRIEDTVVIRDGDAQYLSTLSRDLLVL